MQRHARASLALGAVLACAAAAPASAQNLDVVTDGLSSPHGLAFGPDGKLYVAEAGRGGSGRCIPGPEGGDACYGPTGAITRVDVTSGKSRQILRGLPSLAPQTGDVPGSDALGPNDVSFRGATGYFTIGLGANPAARDQLGRAGRRFAGLYRMGRNGNVRRVADLGAYEAKHDPDKGRPTAEVDTNPFSVDASGSGGILVTDAGGNALLRVSPSGRVRTVAVFPFAETLAPPFLGLPPGTQVAYQPVPTGVVRAPGGLAYVGQLTGFPFPAGAANVFHVA
ncbi:MAG TPA: ScyD/ScyE family protein, partial [Solirubrobacteraceae bacterium]|nr:ScyD/ScyE family protein [Solirubrobacteraceae bacterium]